jgi:hypothetical protein
MSEDSANKGKLRSKVAERFKNKEFFWSFILGIIIALVLVIFGNIVLSSAGLFPYTDPLELYFVIFILSATTGLYFANFWTENDNSVAILLGFLAVMFLSLITIFYKITTFDILLILGFWLGFAFVKSGATNKNSIKVTIYLNKFLRKFSWYLFGLQVTASYEIPVFNKILDTKNYLSENFILGVIIAVLFILFVIFVYKYIDKQAK